MVFKWISNVELFVRNAASMQLMIVTLIMLKCCYRVCCIVTNSIFYEKDTFFCAPHELSTKETGGVALLRGHKVGKMHCKNNVTVAAYVYCLCALTATLLCVCAGGEVGRQCTAGCSG